MPPAPESTDPELLNSPKLLAWVCRIYLECHSAGRHDRQIEYIRSLYARVKEGWESPLSPIQRDDLAYKVANQMRFIELLFTNHNIRPEAEITARCLEHNLLRQGRLLDYQFSPCQGLPLKVGVLVQNLVPRTETYLSLALAKGLMQGSFSPHIICLDSSPEASLRPESGRLSCPLVEVNHQSLSRQVSAIRELDLDILIAGNTIAGQNSPLLELLAHRLARLQLITSAIWPNTTGLSRMDGVLTAESTEPSDLADHYTETPVLVPGMFNCFDMGPNDPRLTPLGQAVPYQPRRKRLLVCGGQLFKLTPYFRKLYIRVLAGLPDSELALYPFNQNWGTARYNRRYAAALRQELADFGVAPSRLVILPNLTPAQITALLRRATLYLDTAPYSGAASFMEPFAARCPVVTLQGPHQRGRQGSAMARDMGLGDLVARDEDQYVELAVKAARDSAWREELARIMSVSRPSCLDVADYGHRVSHALLAFARQRGII